MAHYRIEYRYMSKSHIMIIPIPTHRHNLLDMVGKEVYHRHLDRERLATLSRVIPLSPIALEGGVSVPTSPCSSTSEDDAREVSNLRRDTDTKSTVDTGIIKRSFAQSNFVSQHEIVSVSVSSCWGCLYDQPNQMAHMDPGGCLSQ